MCKNIPLKDLRKITNQSSVWLHRWCCTWWCALWVGGWLKWKVAGNKLRKLWVGNYCLYYENIYYIARFPTKPCWKCWKKFYAQILGHVIYLIRVKSVDFFYTTYFAVSQPHSSLQKREKTIKPAISKTHQPRLKLKKYVFCSANKILNYHISVGFVLNFP